MRKEKDANWVERFQYATICTSQSQTMVLIHGVSYAETVSRKVPPGFFHKKNVRFLPIWRDNYILTSGYDQLGWLLH